MRAMIKRISYKPRSPAARGGGQIAIQPWQLQVNAYQPSAQMPSYKATLQQALQRGWKHGHTGHMRSRVGY